MKLIEIIGQDKTEDEIINDLEKINKDELKQSVYNKFPILKIQFTPLGFAAYKGYVNVVNFLIEKGAKLDSTTLFWAAYKGHKNLVEFLIQKGSNVNTLDVYNALSLHWALHNKHQDIAIILINNWADLNVLDINKKSPIDLAVYYNYPQVVELLIQKGVNVDNIKDKNGRTVLHWAVYHNHTNIITALMQNDKLRNYKDNYGHTPLDWYIKKIKFTIKNITIKKLTTFVHNISRRVLAGIIINLCLASISPFVGNILDNQYIRYGIAYVSSSCFNYFIEKNNLWFKGGILNPLNLIFMGSRDKKQDQVLLANNKIDHIVITHFFDNSSAYNNRNFVDIALGTRALRKIVI